MSKIKIKPWVCEICAEAFDAEVDLLAHQFNSSCEKEILEREHDENEQG